MSPSSSRHDQVPPRRPMVRDRLGDVMIARVGKQARALVRRPDDRVVADAIVARRHRVEQGDRQRRPSRTACREPSRAPAPACVWRRRIGTRSRSAAIQRARCSSAAGTRVTWRVGPVLPARRNKPPRSSRRRISASASASATGRASLKTRATQLGPSARSTRTTPTSSAAVAVTATP